MAQSTSADQEVHSKWNKEASFPIVRESLLIRHDSCLRKHPKHRRVPQSSLALHQSGLCGDATNRAENAQRIKMDYRNLTSALYDLLLFIGMAIIYITEAMILTIIPRRYRTKSIKGEIALVTGGASGIGRLIAKKLAKFDVRVVIWDINKRNLEETVEEIKRDGGKCWGYYCDISDKIQIYKTAKAVKIEVGNVTLLINNAGYIYGKPLWDLPDSEIERTYKINILSHYWTTKSFLEEMIKNNHGHIVTIASVAGFWGTYNCTDYSATKFATIGYHESLTIELKVHGYDGIFTTLVCPYLINTGMFQGVKPKRLPMLDPEYVSEEVVQGILTNRANVILPDSSKFLLLIKCLLPAKMCWAFMHYIVQLPQAMSGLRPPKEQLHRENNNTTCLK